MYMPTALRLTVSGVLVGALVLAVPSGGVVGVSCRGAHAIMNTLASMPERKLQPRGAAVARNASRDLSR